MQLADQRLYDQKAGRSRSVAGQADPRRADAGPPGARAGPQGAHRPGRRALPRRGPRHWTSPADEIDMLVRAAELHDIGKVAVPDSILLKPGPLDDTEWGFVRQHTVVGERILSAAPALVPVARIVRASHERFDGGGYPDGTAGEDIPLGARIVAICDAYHAITSERPYGQARPHEDAIQELRRCAGHQFDPGSWTIFCSIVEPPASRPAARPSPPTRWRSHEGPARDRCRVPRSRSSCPRRRSPAPPRQSGSTVTVAATPGQQNRLTVTLDGPNLRIAETGSGATPDGRRPAASPVGPTRSCARSPAPRSIAMTGRQRRRLAHQLHRDPGQPGRRRRRRHRSPAAPVADTLTGGSRARLRQLLDAHAAGDREPRRPRRRRPGAARTTRSPPTWRRWSAAAGSTP